MNQYSNTSPDNINKGGFAAYSIGNRMEKMRFSGRDRFHKIVLISGIGEVKINSKVYRINGAALFIAQPGIQCSWSLLTSTNPSYICTFNDDFIREGESNKLMKTDNHLSMNSVFLLESKEEKFIRSIFYEMVSEQKEAYEYKEECARSKVSVIILLALRMVPVECAISIASCWSNPSCVSLELVELHFPEDAQVLNLN